ncbi:MAG: CDP-alcohol phosphatidyltransferase family protein [Tannerellaceae bacterium]|jgi:hypothetical protein|nr:CDP-alcohol phosphatidyltransferase family protein [Tannerellaceae bacterium]
MQDRTANPPLESTFKSLDTEEFIDLHFYRPLGYRWALLFRKLGVSPNTVTVMAIFLGMAAGVCFYFSSLAVNAIGMMLLVWANTYDSADGQLARMTGNTSPLGRMLDGFCGDAWFVTIYAAICLRLTPEWGLWIWLLGAVSGYTHTRQASMADYYRNVHLYFLKGKTGSELSNTAALRKEFDRLSWKNDFLLKLGHVFYIRYTREQEKQTPRLQQMLAVLRTRYADRAPEPFRKSFREKSLPLMKYTNMLSFNTRVIALFISLSIRMPWIYFIFEATVLNLMLLYMAVKHERFCSAFAAQLASETPDETCSTRIK